METVFTFFSFTYDPENGRFRAWSRAGVADLKIVFSTGFLEIVSTYRMEAVRNWPRCCLATDRAVGLVL